MEETGLTVINLKLVDATSINLKWNCVENNNIEDYIDSL